MTQKYERDMTITHREFLRLLPKALSGLSHKKSGNVITAESENGSIEIILGEESLRKLGSLELPRTEVRIELNSHSEIAASRFIKRFDLAYQKGGG